MATWISHNQGRRELRKSGGAKSPILPQFLENSLFIAFLCDNFLGFQKSGGAAAPLDPAVTTPLHSSNTYSYGCSNQSFRCGSYFDWLRFYYHQPIIIRSAPSVLIPLSFNKQNLSSIFIRSSKRKFDIFLKISIHFLSL